MASLLFFYLLVSLFEMLLHDSTHLPVGNVFPYQSQGIHSLCILGGHFIWLASLDLRSQEYVLNIAEWLNVGEIAQVVFYKGRMYVEMHKYF